ncbi:CYTH domain-containing protein [Halomonas sp. McH1-25]|uniref:CYTH domain-containing protein n=1 Tax=unclassified Halomonas TaxID=2609666 RepID=UPI001EF61F13|nr:MULTISPECIES: CYTH domain-containing protein [unclassified Halomonas]MCG7601481.1 CYTH domain-containing protein [Halomonas sp. McH1-25]MCP1344295.1 CYTH domain-containing protein [Halomonas sp. FL8]MCP1362941.1 CYTH domain-containing protein [Halomonas sp. BBD45]
MAEEIELKLALAPGEADKLSRHPALGETSAQPKRLANTYYDTPAGDLEAARVALRLRRTPERTLQTLKTAGHGSGGLSARGEWEWEVDGDALDLEGLTALPPMQTLGRDVLQALQPRFTTDFERQAWLIDYEGARIEVALDRGEIRAGERRVAIDELELELKAGEPTALWRLARRLAEDIALRPANASKAARGGALCDNRWHVPAGDDSPASCFDRAILYLDAYRDSGQPAFLDQARSELDTLIQTAKADDVEQHARALADALSRESWLTLAFGQHSLALQAALHPA